MAEAEIEREEKQLRKWAKMIGEKRDSYQELKQLEQRELKKWAKMVEDSRSFRDTIAIFEIDADIDLIEVPEDNTSHSNITSIVIETANDEQIKEFHIDKTGDGNALVLSVTGEDSSIRKFYDLFKKAAEKKNILDDSELHFSRGLDNSNPEPTTFTVVVHLKEGKPIENVEGKLEDAVDMVGMVYDLVDQYGMAKVDQGRGR